MHGGFVDGSGGQAVHDRLVREGYGVSVVQNPALSLEGDATYTRRVVAARDGPVVLVGHSSGGAFARDLPPERARFMADPQIP
ncbi:hypothetical protein [Streptomyces sp. ODS28]|uniref:hypothetical protein n=1 Tax=Streptomyces sp. ODS28 TaxID=3136688 RepID=UPI0031EED179